MLLLKGSILWEMLCDLKREAGSHSGKSEGGTFMCTFGQCNNMERRGNDMAEPGEGCVRPSKGPVGPPESKDMSESQERKEEIGMMARVGKAAPDFEVSAYFEGAFRNVRLSDYKGRWIVLCFYPGDFTFV